MRGGTVKRQKMEARYHVHVGLIHCLKYMRYTMTPLSYCVLPAYIKWADE